MSYTHIIRQIHRDDPAFLDISGPQMIMVIKLTSTAFCIYDSNKDHKSFTSYQKRHVINEMPSILEFFGYVFFFPSLVAGPSFELSSYRKLIQLDDRKVQRTQNRMAYNNLLESIFWMVFYVCLSPYFSYDFMITTEYFSWNLLKSEGSCRLTGLGFDGFDDNQKPKWQSISNINIKKIEFATSQKEAVDSWNIGTNTWLRNYIYLRLLPKQGKSSSRAALVTFIASAFWHGFYPGYYMTFFIGAMGSNAGRLLRRNLRPLVVLNSGNDTKTAGRRKTITKQVYDVLGWFISLLVLNMYGSAFILLDFTKSVLAWQSLYFIPELGIMVILVAFQFLNVGKYLPRPSKQK
ncbi:Lysophospholipid acyltransferase [Mycoemilia scoparia]|uniref:Lysophospholipid acyltransferase n=1 Tax=Mycoemilia scoparia TaxID=417184 RepID=A0A9W8A8R0_9FUNG|nr:Lysophospholipid acyltransferase [Mycoemilia scoparia]